MKKWMRALGAALVGAVVSSAPAFAQELRVGQTRAIALGDERIGALSAALSTRLGRSVAATGATVRRVSDSRFLFCGFYVDQATPAAFPGFAMVHERGATQLVVSAPLTAAEQKRRGCWSGERAHTMLTTADVSQ